MAQELDVCVVAAGGVGAFAGAIGDLWSTQPRLASERAFFFYGYQSPACFHNSTSLTDTSLTMIMGREELPAGNLKPKAAIEKGGHAIAKGRGEKGLGRLVARDDLVAEVKNTLQGIDSQAEAMTLEEKYHGRYIPLN